MNRETYTPCIGYMLAIEYHVHILQVLPQLSCGDTCQIWMWSKEFSRYFCEIENFAYGEIDERSFSNPHPRSACNYSSCTENAIVFPVYQWVYLRNNSKSIKPIWSHYENPRQYYTQLLREHNWKISSVALYDVVWSGQLRELLEIELNLSSSRVPLMV